MDDSLPAASWGMHSPGQGPKQQPLSHGPTQGCYRQLLYPGLESHGSHAHMVPSEPTSGLITQDSSSSSAIKTWLSVPIPPAVTPLSDPPLLHEA